ncbi:pheST operon leader peptide PheM [Xenorhabdus sp. Vera]|nr:pheST operon leader peptide PheM [Xenorhabdus sp. Vera]
MLPLLLFPKIWLTIRQINTGQIRKDVGENKMMKLAFFRFFFYFSA